MSVRFIEQAAYCHHCTYLAHFSRMEPHLLQLQAEDLKYYGQLLLIQYFCFPQAKSKTRIKFDLFFVMLTLKSQMLSWQ